MGAIGGSFIFSKQIVFCHQDIVIVMRVLVFNYGARTDSSQQDESRVVEGIGSSHPMNYHIRHYPVCRLSSKAQGLARETS
jgi:hypothetical protein